MYDITDTKKEPKPPFVCVIAHMFVSLSTSSVNTDYITVHSNAFRAIFILHGHVPYFASNWTSAIAAIFEPIATLKFTIEPKTASITVSGTFVTTLTGLFNSSSFIVRSPADFSRATCRQTKSYNQHQNFIHRISLAICC